MSDFVSTATYQIAAIPTSYGGQLYRSRLEARWAEFFDCLGWRDREYEPFQLRGWFPDFHIPSAGLLVEVKPHDYWAVPSSVTWERIARAAVAAGRKEDLLLTRAVPDRVDGYPCIGWAGTRSSSYEKRHAYVLRDGLEFRLIKADRRAISQVSPDWSLCSLVLGMWNSTKRGAAS